MNSSGFSSGASTSSFIDSGFDQFSDQENRVENLSNISDPQPNAAMSQFSNPSSAASSRPNTDDEEEDNERPQSHKDRRRNAHTIAEKKRRDAIKKGYQDLQNLVPTCSQNENLGVQKISKALVLQRTLAYIEYLHKQSQRQSDDLDKLKKEKMALTIMKANYEHIVKQHQNNPSLMQNKISEGVKFDVYKRMMDNLFESFNASISVANFQELSHCVISWVEEKCTPNSLNEVAIDALNETASKLCQ